LSQYSSWIDPYLLFLDIMLFTLDEMYKSECLHNVPIIILPLPLHLLTYNCSKKFLFKKGIGRLFCPRYHFMLWRNSLIESLKSYLTFMKISGRGTFM
jgi:hypothetical protein